MPSFSFRPSSYTCECASFLMAGSTSHLSLLHTILQFFSKVRAKIYIVPAVKLNAQVFEGKNLRLGTKDNIILSQIIESKNVNVCVSTNDTVYLLKAKKKMIDVAIKESTDSNKNEEKGHPKQLWNKEVFRTRMEEKELQKQPIRFIYNGKSNSTSLFTKKGQKGANQDAMLVLENFTARSDTIFCGVFDGHGRHGHLVAKAVRDTLPLKLENCQKTSLLRNNHCKQDVTVDVSSVLPETPELVDAWKESLLDAYKMMDRELLIDDHVDCVSSGTTAITLVKQGNHLLIGSVGDSRAILGLKTDKNSLIALQLTIDLKPNLPRELARIRRRKGRVFAARKDPLVKRVWLPNCDRPGLAMARAFGDYCLKNFGVISEPVITYRKITAQDRFIVLATDGVWDVLSNEKVIEIVATSSQQSIAAKAVVDAAVHEWKYRFSSSKVDDCAVVCLFLDVTSSITSCSSSSMSDKETEHYRKQALDDRLNPI